jgi:hypothetical protein
MMRTRRAVELVQLEASWKMSYLITRRHIVVGMASKPYVAANARCFIEGSNSAPERINGAL